jgi:hypothetical protein
LSKKGNAKRWLPGLSIDDNRLVKYRAFSVKVDEVISLYTKHSNLELVLEDNFVELINVSLRIQINFFYEQSLKEKSFVKEVLM